MRVQSHVSAQYAKNLPTEKDKAVKRTEPQVKVQTTSIGFSLGKFGVEYESSKTVLDPSLSRDVRDRQRQEAAFKTETEVESLRATVGREGATYRDLQTGTATASPSAQTVRQGLAAYAKSTEAMLPPPGSMLASVV